MDIKWPKPLVNPANQFLRWLNAILTSCISSQPKSTSDITVEVSKEGSYLYVSDALKKRTNVNYPANTNQKLQDDETETDRNARVAGLISAYGTDAPVWSDATKDLAWTKGTIVRVLQSQRGDDFNTYANAGATLTGSTFVSALTGSHYLKIPAGTYICVANVPVSSSNYGFFTASGMDVNAVRNPSVCYHPLFPEPSINAEFHIPQTWSGSKFEDYQGRYWECLSITSTGSNGMVFMGAWSGTASYTAQNVVIQYSGSNAGSYVALSNLPGSGSSYAPDVGSPYWAMLGALDVIGRWQ